MGLKSNNKGKVGEREFSNFIREKWGIESRRGIQYQGSSDSPDIVIGSGSLHCEVKRSETFSLYKALEQAAIDCEGLKTPFVAHRRSRKDWIVVLYAKDVPKFCKGFALETPL